MNFYDDLEKYAGNTAVITDRPERISYKYLLDAADGIGRQIKKRCLVFAICKNCFESVAGYVGILRSGAVPVMIDNKIDSLFLANLLKAYKPGYIYLPIARAGFNPDHAAVHTCGGYSLLETDYDTDYALRDDLAMLMTTSGSTGSPKFVRQSYDNINSNAEAIAQYLGITDSDRPVTTMPMSYTYGLSIINSHLLKGASMILTDATLMDKLFWEIIRKEDATTFGGVPYIYEMLKKLRFSRMSLPGLRYITQAGGRLSPELFAEFVDICSEKDVKFYTMYGQTEATARISYLPWEHARGKVGSIGVAIPGGRLWLEDEERNVIEAGDTAGELVYEGANVTLGYSETCYDLCKGDENGGVLRTGDIARRDSDGFYYIVGRKKRFLKMFGNRVNLDEVEQLMRDADYDCACAGTDDNLIIYVTRTADAERTKNYVVERTGINRAGFSIVHVDEIPRSESNKVLYSALK